MVVDTGTSNFKENKNREGNFENSTKLGEQTNITFLTKYNKQTTY